MAYAQYGYDENGNPVQQQPTDINALRTQQNPITGLIQNELAREGVSQAGNFLLPEAASAVAPEAINATGFAGMSSQAAGGATQVPLASEGATLAPGGYSLPGVVAGAYTGLKQFQGAKNVAKGKDLSLQQQLALALPTFGGSLIYNYTNLGGGKTNKDQLQRDQLREGVLASGLGLKNDKGSTELTLADGTKYDIGLDGGARLADGRRPYDLDLKNELQQSLVPYAQTLSLMYSGGDPKKTSDLTGYFVNAAISNAKTKEEALANLRSFYNKAGVTTSQATQYLGNLKKNGKLDDQAYGVLSTQVQSVAQNDAAKGNSTGGMSFSMPTLSMPKATPQFQQVDPTQAFNTMSRTGFENVDPAKDFNNLVTSLKNSQNR